MGNTEAKHANNWFSSSIKITSVQSMIARGKYRIKITVRVAERLAESQRSKGASSFGSPFEYLSSINTIKQGKESQKVKSVNRLQNEKVGHVRGNTSLVHCSKD